MENFITLGQIRAAFPSKVKPEVHAYVTGGSASELSLRRNRAALERIAVEQRVGMDVRSIDLSTTFLGMDLPLPFTVCPMGGMPLVWPQGDMEMARGATVGGLMGVVNSGGPVKERVQIAGGPLMYQLYNTGRSGLGRRAPGGHSGRGLQGDRVDGRHRRAEPPRSAPGGAVRGERRPGASAAAGRARNDPAYLSVITWEYVRFLRR